MAYGCDRHLQNVTHHIPASICPRMPNAARNIRDPPSYSFNMPDDSVLTCRDIYFQRTQVREVDHEVWGDFKTPITSQEDSVNLVEIPVSLCVSANDMIWWLLCMIDIDHSIWIQSYKKFANYQTIQAKKFPSELAIPLLRR